MTKYKLLLSLGLICGAVTLATSADAGQHARRSHAPAPVAVAPVKKPQINATYRLYAGGLSVVDVNVNYNLQPASYNVFATASTRGMWASLVPWRNVIKSYGTIAADGRLQPEGARYDDVWREKARTQEFTFKPDGHVDVVATPAHKRDGRIEATPEQRRGAIDPLSAVISVITHGAEQGCQGKIPAYDGRRVYNLVLNNKGAEELRSNRYSMFAGSATRCEVTFEPVAGFPPAGSKSPGFWSAKDNSDKKNPLIIWLAKPAPDLPELPVRIQSSVELGTLVAHIQAVDQVAVP